ncbi:hypothetical protein PInf_007210 [Phytophthora infestans]|nr:hypothetical protein PInf_007210 [Phytophthora infestans]
MAKVSGSANYKMAEISRLLNLIEDILPLGKDEWERLAGFYNGSRMRGWPEREFDSLRRKFKVLYSTRKPTATSEMPPHIKLAKELKNAIDDKASVVVMDDGADNEEEDFREDFAFDVEPDDGSFAVGGNSLESVGFGAVAESSADRNEDIGTVRTSASPRTGPKTRAKARGPTKLPKTTETQTKTSVAQNRSAEFQTASNRLGGVDLTTLRDETGSKSAMEGDKEIMEASFAKSKRIRAAKATTVLKSKLDLLETASKMSGGSMLDTILLLRETERKAEIRRAEEDQRRRDDAATQEARRLADKTEAEERRRQDKIEMDERARRDKEEARARTQELILLIASINKKP